MYCGIFTFVKMIIALNEHIVVVKPTTMCSFLTRANQQIPVMFFSIENMKANKLSQWCTLYCVEASIREMVSSARLIVVLFIVSFTLGLEVLVFVASVNENPLVKYRNWWMVTGMRLVV